MSTLHQAAPAGRPRARLLLKTGLILALLGLAGCYAHYWWVEGRYLEDTDDAYVGGDITEISAKVPGLIAQVAVLDNQRVRAGSLLVQLDDRDYRAALAQADATVDAQQALLDNLDATRLQQMQVIKEMRADVTASSAQTVRSAQDDRRYQSLIATEAVSMQSVQRATTDYLQARADGNKASAALGAAQAELTVIATRRRQAAALLQQALAARELARLNLVHTRILAPIDGEIGDRRAVAGAYAAVGDSLLSVVPAHGLWVDANFKENQLARIRPGQTALIVADALPGHRIHGQVASLAAATGAQFSVLPPENATGNFTKIVQRVPVHILLNAADSQLGALRPGLSVEVEIDTRRAP
jgi:membrane fusion protein (multidrug efflux system)